MQELIRKDLAHPELSYKLTGIAFTVSNELGYGHLEKVYQRAFAKELTLQGLSFKEQVPYSVNYKGEVVGKNYLDFLVEETVIVELKRNDIFSRKNIEQVKNYLKVTGLRLAILFHFSKDGVKYKRIVNVK
ncbi:MAG TPA: GxxExxY protein [Bacteroidia bacterium]|jgi:GxxExxY protein|nr:GxxExxY protein [Bacteroidia bacterium]